VYNFWYSNVENIRKSNNKLFMDQINSRVLNFVENQVTTLNEIQIL